MVEKEGLPIMAILPITEYQLFLKIRAATDKTREERLTQFRAAARRVGEKIDERGLTEVDLEAQLDAARQELHQQRTRASNAK